MTDDVFARSQPKLSPDTGWSLRKSEMYYDGSASAPCLKCERSQDVDDTVN